MIKGTQQKKKKSRQNEIAKGAQRKTRRFTLPRRQIIFPKAAIGGLLDEKSIEKRERRLETKKHCVETPQNERSDKKRMGSASGERFNNPDGMRADVSKTKR